MPFFDDARAQRVDAVGAPLVVRALRLPGDEARVVDEEVEVGPALRRASDVDAGRVLVAAPPERQALVHGDRPHAEPPRVLAQLRARLVVEVEADAVRPPLRVGLPRGHAPARRERVHRLDVAGLVRVDAPVQQHAVHAVHALDDRRGRRRLLDLQRLALARRRDERQHDEVRVGIHEDVADELVRARRTSGRRCPAPRRRRSCPRARTRESLRSSRDFVHAPVGSTKWPCTSNTKSCLSSVERASISSSAASRSIS